MGGLRGAITPVTLASESEAIAVVSQGVVYTRAFPLYNGEYFGLWVKAASTGTPDYKIDLEESYAQPTTEGAADTSRWQVVQAITAQINDKLAHILTVSPKPMAWGRYKVTGISSNPADTVLTMKNFIQE